MYNELFQELSMRHPPKRSIPLVPPSIVPVSRNDVTNKFWSMVEPYCAEITLDDVKVNYFSANEISLFPSPYSIPSVNI